MTDSTKSNQPQIELSADEDWKARVKAEDAQRDAAARAESSAAAEFSETAEAAQEPDLSGLPAASLITLLQMLSSQAILGLGLMPGPNGKTTIQLPLAKHFIDLLAVIDTKCRGNLSKDEEAFLEGTLHELRMAYVAVSQSQAGK